MFELYNHCHFVLFVNSFVSKMWLMDYADFLCVDEEKTENDVLCFEVIQLGIHNGPFEMSHRSHSGVTREEYGT